MPGRAPRRRLAARLRILGQVVDHLDDLAAAVTLLPGESVRPLSFVPGNDINFPATVLPAP
jgi:hypothetical protein